MTTIPLYEAIRLGAMLRPQGFGSPSSPWRRPGTSCALEAAVEACGGDAMLMYVEAPRLFPILNRKFTCPVCGGLFNWPYAEPGLIVWHLNDLHHWTREQIAEFFEPLERASLAEAVEVVCQT